MQNIIAITLFAPYHHQSSFFLVDVDDDDVNVDVKTLMFLHWP